MATSDGPAKANHRQVEGTHYQRYGNVQPWDLWWMFKLNPFQATIIKYVIRYKDKHGVRDLKKAIHTLEKLIEITEAEEKELVEAIKPR